MGAEENRDKVDFELSEETTETELAEVSDLEKMKTLWYIEQDSAKKEIKIRPGSGGYISLHGAQEVRHFIEMLEGVIQEIS